MTPIIAAPAMPERAPATTAEIIMFREERSSITMSFNAVPPGVCGRGYPRLPLLRYDSPPAAGQIGNVHVLDFTARFPVLPSARLAVAGARSCLIPAVVATARPRSINPMGHPSATQS